MVGQVRHPLLPVPLSLPPYSDVASNCGSTYNMTLLVADWGDGQCDINQTTVLVLANRFIVMQRFAHLGHNVLKVIKWICWKQYRHVLTNDFIGGVPEHSLSSRIPACNHCVHGLAKNGIVRISYDGGKDFITLWLVWLLRHVILEELQSVGRAADTSVFLSNRPTHLCMPATAKEEDRCSARPGSEQPERPCPARPMRLLLACSGHIPP